ncbi:MULTISPECIES: tyrosine-type recombinase/integrase [Pontibacillus]|uniref:Tyrosine-type recombinase/integrase n=1 Tax=Pontibacillus chungwhensis TaxID=265426 RepID=A0ABY8UZ00_9BACI|nr:MULTISPECIES: tyrosine-type recombinase/integrase [Pontibacillus]MCD5324762.1 tyrosine-type recombinase/integrase [Pontibacillus sp. HN14]WIF98722.1 tyrosine-type recombinase/integrase [Pontibacillus chungwhensis]
MNFVQPIRDPIMINQVKDYLLEKSERNYMLFVIGINTGLRISDILQLKVKDVEGMHINLREKKTKKRKKIRITPQLRRELKWYIADKAPNEYLFKSRKGGNKAIGRSMAYKILRDAADQFGLKEIGTHTLRKTFGYHFYLQTKNTAMLQELFNHSSEKITLIYIGINQDTLDKAMSKFKI